jgi:hypothetical protein
MEKYCLLHGYKFVLDDGTGDTVYDGARDPPWYKLLLVKKQLADCDYCVWIDADSHILKTETKLEHFISTYMGNKDMLFGKEGRSNTLLNTGVMFVKNAPDSSKILELAWNNKQDPEGMHEQDALSDLYRRNDDIQNKVVILPPYLQNEFLTYWYMYNPGDCFIIHATRCSHDREGFVYLMDCYCPIRIREESDEQYSKRMEWLHTKEKCRADIDGWMSGKYIARTPSARNTKGWS